jgi:hypothetical protein
VLHTQEVTGSSPVAPTILFNHFQSTNSPKTCENHRNSDTDRLLFLELDEGPYQNQRETDHAQSTVVLLSCSRSTVCWSGSFIGTCAFGANPRTGARRKSHVSRSFLPWSARPPGLSRADTNAFATGSGGTIQPIPSARAVLNQKAVGHRKGHSCSSSRSASRTGSVWSENSAGRYLRRYTSGYAGFLPPRRWRRTTIGFAERSETAAARAAGLRTNSRSRTVLTPRQSTRYILTATNTRGQSTYVNVVLQTATAPRPAGTSWSLLHDHRGAFPKVDISTSDVLATTRHRGPENGRVARAIWS